MAVNKKKKEDLEINDEVDEMDEGDPSDESLSEADLNSDADAKIRSCEGRSNNSTDQIDDHGVTLSCAVFA